MKHFYVLMLGLPLFGQPTEVRVARNTHQQIVVSYNAPVGDDCTIELSKSSTYAPLAHDVNGGLFTNANSDINRPSTFISGTRRMLVLGARVVDKALDGRRYSRSLSQNAAYYGRLSGCGGTATFTVATQVQPYGMVMDTMPSHPDVGMEGHYGFPSIDINDRTEIITDPFTGQDIRKVQLPKDMTDTNESVALNGTATGTGWTTPGNVTATADCGGVSAPGCIASYSGTTQNVLFVPNGTFLETPGVNRGFLYHLEVDIVARITGGATGTNAQLEICMGTATTCQSAWRTFTVSTTTLAKVTLGDDEPENYFWTNDEFVNEQWWSAYAAIGYRIRVKTTSAAFTAEIDSLTARYKIGVNSNMSSSQYKQFHPLTMVEPADGKTYRLAYFLDRSGAGNPSLYAIATDGTAHFMGPIHASTPANWSFTHMAFDRVDPRVLYGYSSTAGPIKITLSSASGTLSTDQTGIDRDLGQSPKLTYVAMTATGFTIDDQVKALNPLFSDEFMAQTPWTLHMGQNGKQVLKAQISQDAGTWVAIFDPLATKPAGCASCIGAIVAAAPFGAAPNGPQANKFCTIHAMSPGEQADWIHIGGNRQQVNIDTVNDAWFQGPWRIQLKKPGCNVATQDCSIAPTDTTMEVIPVGSNYNFVDPNPGGTEDISIPLAVGDLFIYKKVISGTYYTQWDVGDEYMEVLSKDDTAHTITVRRGTSILNSPWITSEFTSGEKAAKNITNTAQSIPEASYAYGLCRYIAVNEERLGDIAWNFVADPLGDKTTQPANRGVGTYPSLPGITPLTSGLASPKVMHFLNHGDHGVWGKLSGNQAFFANYNYDWCPVYNNAGDSCYNMQVGDDNIDAINGPVNRTILIEPYFAGVNPVYGGSYQSHLRQAQQFGDASGRALEWMADIRPFIGATATTTLVGVSGSTWRVSGPALARKHFPTMAFSGNRILKDISGPGSVINDTKPWTYCVVLIAGECVTGSTVGQIYANSPLKNNGGCYTSNSGNHNVYPTSTFGICVEDTPPYVFGPLQIDISREDTAGTNMRTLSMNAIRPGIQTQFAVPFATGDGQWVTALAENEGWSTFSLVKAGDLPSPQTTLGITFDRVKLNLYHATAAKFRVEFGYRETGVETQYRCTTRGESCVVDTATVSDANPFKFASESLSYISCASNRCQAEIPRRPGRIVFSRALFYDASNALIETRVLPPQ